MLLQLHQHSPIAVPLLPAPVVHAQDSHGSGTWEWTPLNQPEQAVSANVDPQCVSHADPGLAAQFISYREQRLSQSLGASGECLERARYLLGEYVLRTVLVVAAEVMDTYYEPHGETEPKQVGEDAVAMAMDVAGGKTAFGASDAGSARNCLDNDHLILDGDRADVQSFQQQRP